TRCFTLAAASFTCAERWRTDRAANDAITVSSSGKQILVRGCSGESRRRAIWTENKACVCDESHPRVTVRRSKRVFRMLLRLPEAFLGNERLPVCGDGLLRLLQVLVALSADGGRLTQLYGGDRRPGDYENDDVECLAVFCSSDPLSSSSARGNLRPQASPPSVSRVPTQHPSEPSIAQCSAPATLVMWWMLFPRWIWFLLELLRLLEITSGFTLSRGDISHTGICPNHLNPNLWVDAMSTCTRECHSDQECESFEKCCSNVCGSLSCVSSRFEVSPGQQGVTRCEREPSFTCASDGLTYYNPCFMDAEACSKGISLSVVPCKAHLSLSPPPAGATATLTTLPQLTTVSSLQAPLISGRPEQQEVSVGDIVSFLCEVSGRPTPEISWEKQNSGGVRMRPNHVHGNAVVTHIGQLVIYNAQPEDSGVYVCTATSIAGSVHTRFYLSVVEQEPLPKRNSSRLLIEQCQNLLDAEHCGGETLGWLYDPQKNNCFPFSYGNCSRNPFEDYELCMASCREEALAAPCSLPIVQGPCRSFEPRWAYRGSQCQLFIYSGCHGNQNNFHSREACEDTCPYPRCRPCRPRQKMVASFCRSDFVILGRMRYVSEEQESPRALVVIEKILKDEKMGLRFLGGEPLEVALLDLDWSCPCPNVTGSETLIIMGEVRNGMAVLQPDSFTAPSSARRVRKLQEISSKNTCEILREPTQLDEA
ncbi:hypothetical protein DNTS_016182, partial [Danionella cerebrum]